MRAHTLPLLLLACLASSPALAQNHGQTAQQGTPGKREQLSNNEQDRRLSNQRAERIEVEDAGSRVDELRIGGQTQSITVQPKTGELPAYEVQPPGSQLHNRSRSDTNDTNGPRVWNVLKF
ncbi:hypothetical protein G7045_10065 [Acidovorax sp. HDW3]|uniref:hypothetical protein n=1 Tax=Acidovorax sp. HDW3 TaxID=2714923 RepID=UPI001408527E|nr:hypothetical protein [Acidovorax sp. HDW3]QIL44580.1 hypothetical protein G7045_10065 [Acidovorax sp. HDW3]